MKIIISLLTLTLMLFASESQFYYNSGKKVFLTPTASSMRSSSDYNFYKIDNKITLGITNKLIMKLTDSTKLEEILEKFNLKLLKQLSSHLYLLQTNSKNDTINIANTLYKMEEVEFAHPDFLKRSIRR